MLCVDWVDVLNKVTQHKFRNRGRDTTMWHDEGRSMVWVGLGWEVGGGLGYIVVLNINYYYILLDIYAVHSSLPGQVRHAWPNPNKSSICSAIAQWYLLTVSASPPHVWSVAKSIAEIWLKISFFLKKFHPITFWIQKLCFNLNINFVVL